MRDALRVAQVDLLDPQVPSLSVDKQFRIARRSATRSSCGSRTRRCFRAVLRSGPHRVPEDHPRRVAAGRRWRACRGQHRAEDLAGVRGDRWRRSRGFPPSRTCRGNAGRRRTSVELGALGPTETRGIQEHRHAVQDPIRRRRSCATSLGIVHTWCTSQGRDQPRAGDRRGPCPAATGHGAGGHPRDHRPSAVGWSRGFESIVADAGYAWPAPTRTVQDRRGSLRTSAAAGPASDQPRSRGAAAIAKTVEIGAAINRITPMERARSPSSNAAAPDVLAAAEPANTRSDCCSRRPRSTSNS